jgi:hypothetical protein
MVLLEMPFEEFPSHAQERLAMLRLAREGFHHPDLGYKAKDHIVVFCKPPVLELGDEQNK